MRRSARAEACCLCALLAAVCAWAETPLFKKVGDEVVLTPAPVPDAITSITWREGLNLAMEWHGGFPKPDSYRQFIERGSLNTTTGAMTITGLIRSDSNTYEVEINSVTVGSFDLRVISAVTIPIVSHSCNDERTSCVLTCNGNSRDAEPVTYTWKSGNVTVSSTRELEITRNNSSTRQFFCELRNPVSSSSSNPFTNPLPPITDPTENTEASEEESEMNVPRGVIVFACLLVTVLLVVVVHRCKAGMWFFQKESMPWQQDFWMKENTSEDRAGRHENHAEEQTLTKNSSSGPVEGQSGSGEQL